MNLISSTIQIERDGVDCEVEVRFEFHRAYRGLRDSLGGIRGAGPPLEPDEPAELEFYDATCNGQDFNLTDDEIDRAREQSLASVSE